MGASAGIGGASVGRVVRGVLVAPGVSVVGVVVATSGPFGRHVDDRVSAWVHDQAVPRPSGHAAIDAATAATMPLEAGR
jgi:hypothetical protein